MAHRILERVTWLRGPALGVVCGVLAGCLFSSDTEGLKCTKNAHCQQGQVCADQICTPAAEGTAGVETDGDTDDSTGSDGGTGS
jgi:hypothetical protein